MKPTKDRPAQRFDRAPGANISQKLQKIVTDIRECGHANSTRLTVLKRWFQAPHRLQSFGIFIAGQALRQTQRTTKDATELFRWAHEILADVDVFEPDILRTGAIRLHAHLEAFQNERREMRWASVRLIHNQNLFLVESGLGLYLWHSESPTEGYRLAAAYCEHYDPRYGSGLSGPSVNRIEEITGFVLATEANEELGTKSPFPKS
jgi:hypothetical protein